MKAIIKNLSVRIRQKNPNELKRMFTAAIGSLALVILLELYLQFFDKG